MVAVPSAESVCPDFGVVLAALEQYTRRTGRTAARLGGWEVADEAMAPPDSLAERLTAIGADLHAYTYARDLARAKELTAEVLGATIRLRGEPLTARDVAVLQNSSQGLLLALAALKERGARRLVVAAPCYYAAVRSTQALGLAVEIVPAADYLTGALDVDALRDATARRGTVLLVTNPAYSVGVEYSATELDRLFAALRPDLPILLDETRLGLHWRSSAPWYPADYPANVAVLRSPSKVFFVNGAKCGLLLAAPTLVRAVERLSEALVGSAPGNAEAVALTYLDAWGQWGSEHASGVTGEMLRWREAVVERMRQSLAAAEAPLRGHGIILAPADSGPYALAAIPRPVCPGIDSLHMARAAGVLVMDSSYFFHTSGDWAGFRLNLCVGPRRISAALDRMLRHLPAGHSSADARDSRDSDARRR